MRWMPALIVALLAVPSGAADVKAGLPLRDVVFISDTAHAVWRVRAPAGAEVKLELLGTPTQSNHMGWAFWIVEVGSETPSDWWSGVLAIDEVEVNAQVGLAGRPRIFADFDDCAVWAVAGSGTACRSYAYMEGTLATAGDWLLLAVGGSEAPWQAELRLYADPSIDLLDRGEGHAFFARASDFEGLANVRVSALAQVNVVERGVVQARAAGNMFAVFSASSSLMDPEYGYDGPDGTAWGEPSYVITAGNPGAYRFRVDRLLDAGLGASLRLIGADVHAQGL